MIYTVIWKMLERGRAEEVGHREKEREEDGGHVALGS